VRRLRKQRDELLRLYRQLSSELAETNRGVVALYAELDQRSADLRAASEAKTRFMTSVGHELRAPVTAILGLVRLLRDPGSDPLTADQAEQLALLEGSAADLLGLVNELLDLAKAESGRLEPRWGTVNLSGLFGALRGTMRSISRAEVEVVVEEPDGLPPLRSDESMLTQVLRNLMTNAIKFTFDGEVRLAARPVGADRVAFTVSDTGIGIPPADHERIFEEFYQVPGAAQADVTGTGLGLPYARRLVSLLGGELTLTSAVGEGSTFTAVLPLAPPEGA
jgi:signal transduction histidine kinase